MATESDARLRAVERARKLTQPEPLDGLRCYSSSSERLQGVPSMQGDTTHGWHLQSGPATFDRVADGATTP